MWIEFLKAKAGLAYFKGDKVNIPDEEARRLIEGGFVVPVEHVKVESDLPIDLPGRTALIKNGLITKAQVLDSRITLTEIPGIGEIMANQIIEHLTKK